MVNEEDLETIDFSEPEDLFQGGSILKAANKVLEFNEFKKQQEEAIKYLKSTKTLDIDNGRQQKRFLKS